jgi:hypothetical protein
MSDLGKLLLNMTCTHPVRVAATLVLVLLSAFAVSSARAAEPLIPPDQGMDTAQAGYGRVVGRIVVTQDGKEKTLGVMDDFRVRLRSLDTDQKQSIAITGDGSFNWPLKPGHYVLQSFSYHGSVVRLWMSFSVVEPGWVGYVGDLRLMVAGDRFGVTLVDGRPDASEPSKDEPQEAKVEPVKALMRPEVIGSYKRVIDICVKVWEITCDRTYNGVMAVLPEGTKDRSPKTADLTPQFEWKPSGLEGVSYDVAIFESESLNLLGNSKERGKLVAYAEGLHEAKYRPDKPLDPGKNYLWSVRLRKDDMVSTWTTTSYFTFLIIASFSGTGQWYAFTTPEQK